MKSLAKHIHIPIYIFIYNILFYIIYYLFSIWLCVYIGIYVVACTAEMKCAAMINYFYYVAIYNKGRSNITYHYILENKVSEFQTIY